MRYLSNKSTDPRWNMAFDEFCLQGLNLDEPVFYLWQNRPSVIIGLNQNAFAEINREKMDRFGAVLARRVTGGGAVYHDLGNLNYTIVGRSSDLDKDYPGYLTMVVDALRSLGVPAQLSGRNDILVDGRKVSGYAKRVWKDRLMIHGTLMYDVDIEVLTAVLSAPGSKLSAAGVASVRSRVANLKEYLPQFEDIGAFRSALHDILAAGDVEVRLSADDLTRVEESYSEKFSSWEWNYGHSLEASFCKSAKLSCGTVTTSVVLDKGKISSVRFGGDFLGNLPADTLTPALVGCRCTKEDIKAALDDLDVSNCFDGLSAADLLALLLP